MPEVRVPGAMHLAEGKTQVFSLGTFSSDRERYPRNGFVIRYEGKLLAFLNECPHWSVDLDMGDEDFFDQELGRVYCKNHGALFVLPSGECETGPCLGRSLTAYSVRVQGDDVFVAT